MGWLSTLTKWWHQERAQRFFIWSGISFVTIFLLCVLFVEVFLFRKDLAFASSVVIVFFINFAASRYYIFNDSSTAIGTQFLGFLVGSIGFRLAEYIVFYWLVNRLELNYQVVFVGVTGVSMVSKQLFYRLSVFKR